MLEKLLRYVSNIFLYFLNVICIEQSKQTFSNGIIRAYLYLLRFYTSKSQTLLSVLPQIPGLIQHLLTLSLYQCDI